MGTYILVLNYRKASGMERRRQIKEIFRKSSHQDSVVQVMGGMKKLLTEKGHKSNI